MAEDGLWRLRGDFCDSFARGFRSSSPKNTDDSDVPLVIDNGSFSCRAGFAHSGDPAEYDTSNALAFRPLVYNRRGGKSDMAVANFLPIGSTTKDAASALPTATQSVSAPDLWAANGLRVDLGLTSAYQRNATLFGGDGRSGGSSVDGAGSSSGRGSGLDGGSRAREAASSPFAVAAGAHGLASAFSAAVVYNYDLQERVLDHVFESLGMGTAGRVPHPIVITEKVANPSLSRKYMLELLFEAYDVPTVCVGVDSLFSLFYEDSVAAPEDSRLCTNSVVVSAGNTTTEVFPVVDSTPVFSEARRTDVGGELCTSYMQRLLHAGRPDLRTELTYDRVEDLTHSHCYCAADGYAAEIDKFFPSMTRKSGLPTVSTVSSRSAESSGPPKQGWDALAFDKAYARVIQLPFTPAPVHTLSAEELAEQERQRAERSARLRLMLEERRLQKQVASEAKLVEFEGVLNLRPVSLLEAASGDEFETAGPYRDGLERLGLFRQGDINDDRFVREYFKLKKQVLAGRKTPEAEALVQQVEVEERGWTARVERERFALVALSPDDPRLSTKKMQTLRNKQISAKALYDGQQRARLAAQEMKRKKDARDALEEEQFREDPDRSLFELRSRRAKLLTERARREKAGQRRVGKSRHTAASLQRMSMLAQLADGDDPADGPPKKRKRTKGEASDGDDDFGMDDSDWNAYLHVQKEKGAILTDTGEVDMTLLSSEEREEREALAEVCRLLARFDPEYKEDISVEESDASVRAAHALLNVDDEAVRAAIQAEEDRLEEERSRLTFARPVRGGLRALAAEDFQFTLGAERIRVPELLFEPSLGGLSQMGVSEVLELVVNSLQRGYSTGGLAAGNVVVTGGASQFSGIGDRIRNEVRRLLPVGAPVNVHEAAQPMWGAFLGASLWSARESQKGTLERSSFSNGIYHECGPDYLKEHFFASNIGFRSNW
jgi:actin-related protein 5